jgi:predicted metal-binding protein
MTQTTLWVCSLCRFSAQERCRDGVSGGQFLIDQLQQALAEHHLEETVRLEPLRCMAGCHQPCNVSLAAPGKLTFILSGVAPDQTAPAIAEFCQQYTDSPDGRVPYRSRPPLVQETTAFVLPPLPPPAAPQPEETRCTKFL